MAEMRGEELLQAFARVTPYLKALFTDDIFISITTRDSIIIHQPPASFSLGIKNGDQLKEEAAVSIAMKEKARKELTVDKAVYGVPYKAVAMPVYGQEDYSVIGGVIIGKSTEQEEKLKEIINQFAAAFQEVNSSIQEISSAAQNLARIGEQLSAATQTTEKNIRQTDEVIELIRHIGDQTKMLGLNAAIEAARAGEAGRGFAVVADEIRRLSDQSNSSAKQVGAILKMIAQSIDQISGNSQETSAISQEQAAATQEVASSMEELAAQLESLNDMARLL